MNILPFLMDHIWYFFVHIILGSVKSNLKLRVSLNTYEMRIGEEAYVVCVYIIKLKLKSIPITSTYHIFTIMNLASGVLHIIHHSSVQGESTPNL